MVEIPSTTAAKVVSTLGEQLESATRCMIEWLEQSGSVIQAYHLAGPKWKATGTPNQALSPMARRLQWFFDQVVDHRASPYPADGPCCGGPNAEVAR